MYWASQMRARHLTFSGWVGRSDWKDFLALLSDGIGNGQRGCYRHSLGHIPFERCTEPPEREIQVHHAGVAVGERNCVESLFLRNTGTANAGICELCTNIDIVFNVY